MITNSKQVWEIGQQVNVGFLKGLTVLAKIQTPGDYAPDAYVLTRGGKYYSFVPHNGLTSISRNEVSRMVDDETRIQDKAAAKAKAAESALVEDRAFVSSILNATRPQAA